MVWRVMDLNWSSVYSEWGLVWRVMGGEVVWRVMGGRGGVESDGPQLI